MESLDLNGVSLVNTNVEVVACFTDDLLHGLRHHNLVPREDRRLRIIDVVLLHLLKLILHLEQVLILGVLYVASDVLSLVLQVLFSQVLLMHDKFLLDNLVAVAELGS